MSLNAKLFFSWLKSFRSRISNSKSLPHMQLKLHTLKNPSKKKSLIGLINASMLMLFKVFFQKKFKSQILIL